MRVVFISISILVAIIIGCGKGLDDYSVSSFAERIAVTTTTVVAQHQTNPVRNFFLKTAIAETNVTFPSFTYSPEDSLGVAVCSELDYYIDGTSELKIMPISDVTSPKLVVGETYHFLMKATYPGMSSVPGKFTCDSMGCRGEAKATADCQFWGTTVTGNWSFSLNCSEVEIVSQTTKGDVFLRANSATSSCTLTANGKARSDDGSSTKNIQKTVTFDVVAADSNTPSITKVEFDGKELPLGKKIKVNLEKLDHQFACGQTAPGFTTAACAGSGSTAPLSYTTFKASGENLSSAAWSMTHGTLGSFGYTSVEFYWAAVNPGKGVPVGMIVTALNANSVMTQAKALIYPKD